MEEITWPQYPIDRAAVDKIRQLAITAGDFSPTPSGEQIQRMVAATEQYFSPALLASDREELVRHMRSTLLTEEIIKNYSRARSAASSRRVQEIYSSRGILEASRFARVAPMGLFKELMVLAGHSGDLVLRAMNGRVNAEVYFSPRDCVELREACSHDLSCPAHQAKRLVVSEANEQALVHYFRSRGISLRTQEELIRSGHTHATPDILFDSPVAINGHVCHWLDNKDFVALPAGKIHESALRQAERNNRYFGPGAFCCRGTTVPVIGGAAVFDTMSLFVRGPDNILVPRGENLGEPAIDTDSNADTIMGKSKSHRKSTRKSRRSRRSKGAKRGGSQPSSRNRYSSRSSKATDQMTITELQLMAKQRGIIFAGLSKQKLIEKINKYTR